MDFLLAATEGVFLRLGGNVVVDDFFRNKYHERSAYFTFRSLQPITI